MRGLFLHNHPLLQLLSSVQSPCITLEFLPLSCHFHCVPAPTPASYNFSRSAFVNSCSFYNVKYKDQPHTHPWITQFYSVTLVSIYRFNKGVGHSTVTQRVLPMSIFAHLRYCLRTERLVLTRVLSEYAREIYIAKPLKTLVLYLASLNALLLITKQCPPYTRPPCFNTVTQTRSVVSYIAHFRVPHLVCLSAFQHYTAPIETIFFLR